MRHSRNYDTRLDGFRDREQIPILLWAAGAGMSRTQLGKYRAGKEEPRSNALADLVRSASRILGRSVNVSELYDLGEDEPVAKTRAHFGPSRKGTGRKSYSTRFDKLLRRFDIPQAALAKTTGISRQALRNLRANLTLPMASTIGVIVSALRRLGFDVIASDLFDVGEE